MRHIAGGITAPQGFLAAGVWSGIKRGRQFDLALIVSDRPAQAAGVFTANRVQAAPVRLSKQRLQRGVAQAIIANSGCANCLTGPAGAADARRLADDAAAALELPPPYVLTASTGMIGRRLPVARLRRAIPTLVGRLSRRGSTAAAQAILTTDRSTKQVAVDVRLRRGTIRLGGIAKGAGMVAPHMATMLGFITTDAAVPAPLLRRMLRAGCERSFNAITVDGDMSTNDSVFLLANGAAGVSVASGGEDAQRFQVALDAVMEELAAMLVADGEGATKVAAVRVTGAATPTQARRCARQVANSPLVKTMLAGSDVNPGRIAAAVGASGARFHPLRWTVALDGLRVLRGDLVTLTPRQERAARAILNRDRLTIAVDLAVGRAASTMWTCDLTKEYVHINASYAS